MQKNDEIIVHLEKMKLAAICKVSSDYYYDETKIWEDGIYPHRIKIEPVKIPANPIDIKKTYDIYFGYKGSPGGYFRRAIRPLPDKEFSIFQSELARNMNELHRWNKTKSDLEIERSEPTIFVTGYHYANVKHSIDEKILGWRTQPHKLRGGDYVFVYDYNNHRIDAGFRILAETNNDKPIWEEELNSQPKKIEFPFRWDAELICENLNIDLKKIDEFEPFKNIVQKKFIPLIKNDFPSSLNDNKYTLFRNFLLNKCKGNELNSSEEKYFALRWELDSKYQDKEGIYHFTTNVPKHSQIVPGVNVVFDRNVDGQIVFLGRGKVTEIKENKTGNKTANGREIIDKLAYLEKYEKFDPPIPRSSLVARLMQSIVGYNNQHSIRVINREIFDLILQNDGWNFDIDTVSKAILMEDTENELAVDIETVKRIILHLKAGKHVILTGPPGVGKTDLAKRILSSVGSKFTKSNDQPYLEAVASDEWGRNETIGGLNLDNQFKEGWITRSVNTNKWLLIDEFNRANMNKAFGEMFLAIEYKTITLRPQESEQYGKEKIDIPKDFRMICTMNDFDKNLLLTELSYGLTSRFAVVGIAPDRDREQKVVSNRIKSELNDKTIFDRYKEQIETYYKFIKEVREKRVIGVRTSIDVIRFLVNGSDGNDSSNLNWKLLNYALSDYLLPQFDRLDREIIEHVLKSSDSHLKHTSFESFKKELTEAKQRLENATGWFAKER
jgi:MoxR-like ATPase